MSNIIIKDINYLGRDFGEFRNNLIRFAQTYFPNTYVDFNETDPGMLFIESAAYVGDVLSFYTDIALRENLLPYAQERENIIDLANSLGYKVKNTLPAVVQLDIYQIVPSIGVGSTTRPDYNYALTVGANTTVSSRSDQNITFRTLDDVNFKLSSSLDTTEVSIYQIDILTNEPTYYLLKKKTKGVSGNISAATFNFTNPKPYDKVTIPGQNISSIIDVYDSDGNRWYEVPYLATDTIFEPVENSSKNDPDLHYYKDSVPYLMKLLQVPRRFVSRFIADGSLVLQFGSGISSKNDEELIPNPDLVGNSLTGFENYNLDYSIDPSNFLYTKTYGLAPQNTTLTVRYTVTNGILDNIGSGELTEAYNTIVKIDRDGLDDELLNLVIKSVSFNNPGPATGGKSFETIDEIRLNASANFTTQNRVVTKEDYIVRVYSLPSKFGSVAKAYILQDDQLNPDLQNSRQYISNPLAMNLYILSYDNKKRLIKSNIAIKENIKTYLSYYRMLTDAINIKDAFIINLGIDFEIYIRPEYNSNEVLVRCITTIQGLFNIDRLQINQPIYIANIYTELDKVEGVQTVASVNVLNKFDSDYGYSGNVYDIQEATRNGVIFPSLDPSIFEIRFPNRDINGRVLNAV